MPDPKIHLDRAVSSLNSAVGSLWQNGATTWTLPYDCPVDGSEGTLVVVSGDSQSGYPFGTIIPGTTRSSSQTIEISGPNLVNFEVFIGVIYDFVFNLSTLYPRRNVNGGPSQADTRGKLQLRDIEFEFSHTALLKVEVAVPGRVTVTTKYSTQTEDDGSIRVPILANNELASITLKSDGPLGCRIHSASWEGFHHVRNRSR